jgi:hypothetical protein
LSSSDWWISLQEISVRCLHQGHADTTELERYPIENFALTLSLLFLELQSDIEHSDHRSIATVVDL